MYYVYAICSLSFDKIYVGYTSDLNGRLVAHNHPKNKGWTKKFQPWILIYSEKFATKSQAMNRENELKSFKGREFLKGLIKTMN